MIFDVLGSAAFLAAYCILSAICLALLVVMVWQWKPEIKPTKFDFIPFTVATLVRIIFRYATLVNQQTPLLNLREYSRVVDLVSLIAVAFVVSRTAKYLFMQLLSKANDFVANYGKRV